MEHYFNRNIFERENSFYEFLNPEKYFDKIDFQEESLNGDMNNLQLYGNDFFNSNKSLNLTPKFSNLANNNTNERTNLITEIVNKKDKIFTIKKMKSKKNNLLGRKRFSEKTLDNNIEKGHTKYAFDNTVRKIKSRLFQAIINLLNNNLEEESKLLQIKDRKRKIPIRKESFLKINQQIISNTTVQYNLNLLNKKLRDIFSEPVSLKLKEHSVYGLNYNKNFIQKIEGDENRKKTNEILNMTLFQCLEHFRNSKSYEVLIGLEQEYQNVIDEMKKTEEKEYVRNFVGYLNNFEELYKQKKPKNGKNIKLLCK